MILLILKMPLEMHPRLRNPSCYLFISYILVHLFLDVISYQVQVLFTLAVAQRITNRSTSIVVIPTDLTNLRLSCDY